jgi:hypothetical protein
MDDFEIGNGMITRLRSVYLLAMATMKVFLGLAACGG